MESARLDLELRNDTHRYSPPNAASPLYGNLAPGRRVWVRAAYPFDSLSGTPGARLADRVPDLGAEFSWTEHGDAFEIAPSGAGVRTAGARTGQRTATIDLGSPDVSFGCWFTRNGSSSHGGLCLRRSADGYLYIRVTRHGYRGEGGPRGIARHPRRLRSPRMGRWRGEVPAGRHARQRHTGLRGRPAHTRGKPRRSTPLRPATACSARARQTTSGVDSAGGCRCSTGGSTRYSPGPAVGRNTAT